MSRVAQIRRCASSCERLSSSGSRGSYNSCLSRCTSPEPSPQRFATIEYIEPIPRSRSHRATIERIAVPHRVAYEYHRMPVAQRGAFVEEPSLLGLTTGAARSIANMLRFGAASKRKRTTRAKPKARATRAKPKPRTRKSRTTKKAAARRSPIYYRSRR